MAFRMWDALGYVDEVIGIAKAFIAYNGHKDEGVFAEELLEQVHSAIQQAYGAEGLLKVDEQMVKDGLVQIIQGIEPLFGTEP